MNPLNLEGVGGGGLENLEVVYFPGTNFFEILRGGYLLGGGLYLLGGPGTFWSISYNINN